MSATSPRTADLRAGEDVVGDRHALIAIGMAAVFIACAVFALLRLASEVTSGHKTPWWANAAGAVAIGGLALWHRRAPALRSAVAVHGTALVATLALLAPAAYGMASSKWWLSLVGFSVLLMGRRREAVVWTAVTLLLVPLTAAVEPFIQVPGAAGESIAERALAGFVYVALLLGVTGAFRRVARRRARELAETADSLERANRVKGQFLGHMSHEIRTPLHGVIAMTDVALAGEASPEVQRQVRLAQDSARVLLGLLNDLLDVTRAEAGGLDLDRRAFRLHAALGEVLRPLAARAQAQGLAFEAHAAPGVAEARVGDRTRVGQVVMNLVSNALKFTAAGRVAVSISETAEDPDVVEIAVADTGPGIPPGALERIFRPFEQVHPSDHERQGGAGLGLAIVREIAGAMHGRVTVTSELGRGSVFTARLRLPRERKDGGAGPEDLLESPEPVVSHARERTGRRLRVLACEDGAIGQRVLTAMFANLGHELTLVPNGAEAWPHLERETFDVLLTDVEMPLVDGLELTRRVRAREAGQGGPRLRIVGATAHVGEPERHRLLAAGMDGHLPKPFTLDELSRALDAARSRDSVVSSAPPRLSAQPALDPGALSDLLSTGDAGALLEELADRFVEESRVAASGLRAALGRGAADEVSRLAHSLRGAARVLGLVRVAELTATLEASPSSEDAASLVDAVEAEIPAAAEALRAAGRGAGASRRASSA